VLILRTALLQAAKCTFERRETRHAHGHRRTCRGDEILKFQGDSRTVDSVIFSPDDRDVSSGGWEDKYIDVGGVSLPTGPAAGCVAGQEA